MKEININEIVKIEQMPIVFSQLEKIGELIDENTKDLSELQCTEDNKKEVKKRRTEINNTLSLLEDRRKFIKNKLLEPYEIFNEKYENECKNKLQQASILLKDKIDTIEEEQLKVKREELQEFANEWFISKKIENLVKFEDIGLNITLSASMKSLKDNTIAFCERIANDLKLIELEEYKDEILIEYKNNFDFANSKIKVCDRHKQIEEMNKTREEVKKEEIEMVETVEEIVEELTVPEEIEEEITLSFTVTATKSKLRELREWMKENEISYE